MTLKVRGESKSEMTWKNSSWWLDDVLYTYGVPQMPPYGLHTWTNKDGGNFDLRLTQVSVVSTYIRIYF